jgi:hypothetical protein
VKNYRGAKTARRSKARRTRSSPAPAWVALDF